MLLLENLVNLNREEKNTIGIPWIYNPDPPHSPKIDEFMAHISANRDGSVNIMKEQFLYQIAGYSLLKRIILVNSLYFKVMVVLVNLHSKI